MRLNDQLLARLKKITYDNDVNFIQYIVAEHRFIYINLTDEDHRYEFDDAHFLASFHPADGKYADDILKMMLNGENRHYGCECRYYLPRINDFSWESVDVNVFETDAEGKVLSYMAVCRSTDKWHIVNNNLKLFRKKVSFITKLNGVMFIQYDVAKHVFIRLDDTGENAFKYIPLVNWKSRFHPDDAHMATTLLSMLDSRKDQTVHLEYRYQYPDEYNWFSVDIAPYEYGDSGKIESYMCIVIDIDQSKKSLLKMSELRKRAEQSNKMKEVFIQQLSHEIRTPLNSILGFSELMTNHLSDEEYETFRRIIRENADRLLRIVDDTINISLIEAGYAKVHTERTDIGMFFAEIYQSMRVLIHPHLTFTNLGGEPLQADIDRRVVSEVLNALVMNADKFTPQGTITMQYQAEGGGIQISVSDTGIGIREEDRQRIFRRFEKIDSFTQGMGMGLAVSKSLVEKMGGSIGVHSSFGHGSTFWFWIPCRVCPSGGET